MITVVIPSRNRPQYLKRAIDYWGKSHWSVVIADGSTEPFTELLPPNIRYFRDNGESLPGRITRVLETLETEFAVLCADDDFLGFTAIDRCLEFLTANPDYSAAQGEGFKFAQIVSPRFLFVPNMTPKTETHKVDAASASARMQHAMKPYSPVFYAVQRRQVLTAAVKALEGITNPNPVELQLAIVPSIFGKHAILPFFYSARETIAGSAGTEMEDIESWLSNPKSVQELDLWRRRVAEIYSRSGNGSIEDGLDAFELALTTYREYCAETKAPPSARVLAKLVPLIKAVLPEKLLAMRRRAIYRADNNESHFPWGDASALEDWARMKAVIQKHGVL